MLKDVIRLEVCDGFHIGRKLPPDDVIKYEKCLIDYYKLSEQDKKSKILPKPSPLYRGDKMSKDE